MLSNKVNIDGQGHRRNRRLFWILGAAGYLGFLVWLYWPAMDSFFANDDWVILYHNAPISPSHWWKYFSFHTVWFYRPLQSMQFGLTYHAAGLNHFVYNLELLILHLILCAVSWLFLKRLFSKGIATGALLMFSISWVYANILIWKANYNTVQFAVTTVTSALAFTLYLDTRLKRWFLAVLAFSLLNCLTKESAVGLPLILSTVWFTRFLQWKWSPMDVPASTIPPVSLPAGPRKVIGHFIVDLMPVSLIVIGFAVIHHFLFKNIETNYLPGYRFATPWLALKQWMHGTTHSTFGLVYDPVILEHFPRIQKALVFIVEKGWFIPPVLIGLSFIRKNVAALFGLVFAIVTQFPTFALESYHAGRYYYLPALGGGVFIISWLLGPLRSILRQDSSLKHRLTGYAACVFLAWFAVGNIVLFQKIMSRDHMESNLVIRVFDVFKHSTDQLPGHAMLVLKNMPETFSSNGMGVSEMYYFATGRQDVSVVTDSEFLSKTEQDRYESGVNLFYLDVTSTSPQIAKLSKR